VTTEQDVGKGAGIAIGVAAAACSVVPGVGTAACAAGAAIASAFVALGTAISAGLRDTYHPDAPIASAQLAIFEALPSALWAGYDTLDIHGFSNPVGARTGTPAADACRLVRYDLLVAGIRLSGGDPLYNPEDRDSKSNRYLEAATPDPAWPLTDARVTSKLYGQVMAHGGDCNDPSIQPLPKTPEEARALLAVLRSPHFKDSGIMGWDPTKNVLPGLRRNAGRLMALAGEPAGKKDEYLSGLLGGPVATDASAVPAPTAITAKIATAQTRPTATTTPAAPAAPAAPLASLASLLTPVNVAVGVIVLGGVAAMLVTSRKKARP
jgi:hypothetical protein